MQTSDTSRGAREHIVIPTAWRRLLNSVPDFQNRNLANQRRLKSTGCGSGAVEGRLSADVSHALSVTFGKRGRSAPDAQSWMLDPIAKESYLQIGNSERLFGVYLVLEPRLEAVFGLRFLIQFDTEKLIIEGVHKG